MPSKPSLSTLEVLGLLILILFHGIASYHSFGFHHPDEHFQILEFANYWIGQSTDLSMIPWEYAAKIRPWFQPMIHGLVMKFALWIHLYEPFTMTYFFRVIYSALNIYGVYLLWCEFKKRYALNPLWFVMISMIWFFPYIHVRTSSENLCGIFLNFAFVAYLRNKNFFWVGLLFGFSFLARYQVALGIFGFGLFLLYQDRKITRGHLALLGGFLIPVILGVLLDRVGYGAWVFTPYLYFKVNLVDGVAATFNPYPWYQYFIWITELNPLISWPLLIGTIYYMRRVRGDALSAFIFSFFILHLFITNKEYRFLFPILNLVPFLAAVGFQKFENSLFTQKKLLLYGVINGLSFSVSSLHGASIETLWGLQMASRYSKPGETWLSNRNYLEPFSKGYYLLKDHHVSLVHDGKELVVELDKRKLEQLDTKVLADGHLQDSDIQGILSVLAQNHCNLISSARPSFLYTLREKFPGTIFSAMDRLSFKALYQCDFRISKAPQTHPSHS